MDDSDNESETVVDVEKFLADTLSCCNLQSPVPEITLKQECCMGIDEAGRGPVLGPMVYGTSFCPSSAIDAVKELGVADSKVLKEADRNRLFSSLCSSGDMLGWKVIILSPNYISNCMLQRAKYNLNAISHDTAINLIRQVLADGINLKKVFVDTVGDPTKYQDHLQRIFPNLSITVSKKADSLYPIVSAASICAKVIRDACLKNWRFSEKINVGEETCQFGSGYTSDPNTISWLKKNVDPVFGYSTLVRFSWSTCRNLLDSKAVEVKWPDDEETEDSIGCSKIGSFFAKSSQQHKRHRYFEEIGLKHISEL